MTEVFTIRVQTPCGRLAMGANIGEWLSKYPERVIALMTELRKEQDVSTEEDTVEGTVWPMELKKYDSGINSLVNIFEHVQKFVPDLTLETVVSWRAVIRFYVLTKQKFDMTNLDQAVAPSLCDILLFFQHLAKDGGDSLWRKAVASGATEKGKKEWLLAYADALPAHL